VWNSLSANTDFSSLAAFRRTVGATENAPPENARLENDGQLRKESQGLENAGLDNDGPC